MMIPSNCHVASIIENLQWLEALNQWYFDGGHAYEVTSPSFGLTLDSWRALQIHLIGTGWFGDTEGKITPTVDGYGFLARVNELYRAICRGGNKDRVVTQILTELPRGPAVDVGCGPGFSVLQLTRLGYSPVYAYDLSPIALEIARALLEKDGKTAHLYVKDATFLSEIETGTLALIYSRGALHYFDQVELSKTINRILRPGGHLVSETVGLRYYLQTKHFRSLLNRHFWWHLLSYWRTVLRTLIYETLALQPRLAAKAPEIGYTSRSLYRLARQARLEVLSISPAPSSVGHLVVMRKPVENGH